MPCIKFSFDPKVGPVLKLGFTPPGAIGDAAARQGTGAGQVTGAQALVDTGASVTCVTEEVARHANLPLIGKMPSAGVHGVREMNVYMADIILPFGDPTRAGDFSAQVTASRQVMEFQTNSSHYQALLGRDILCSGLLEMAGWDKSFIICM